MSDDALIRRENLQRLVKARGWTVADLARRLSARYTYCRDLLRDSSKSFGEKAARRLEEQLDLPRSWLDRADPVPAAPDSDLPDPSFVANEPPARYGPETWPLSAELLVRLGTLNREELGKVESVVRALLGMKSASD